MIDEIFALKSRCSKRRNIKVVFGNDCTTFINERDVIIPVSENCLKVQHPKGRVLLINMDKVLYVCLNEVWIHG